MTMQFSTSYVDSNGNAITGLDVLVDVYLGDIIQSSDNSTTEANGYYYFDSAIEGDDPNTYLIVFKSDGYPDNSVPSKAP